MTGSFWGGFLVGAPWWILFTLVVGRFAISSLGLHICNEDPAHPPRAFRVDELQDGIDDDLKGEF
jgi:hypothetical protein